LAGLFFLFLLGRLAAAPSPFTPLATLVGQSGKLRAVFTLPGETPSSEVTALRKPGVYALDLAEAGVGALRWIVLTPFSEKVAGRIGSYRMGNWPFEHRPAKDESYANPRGFIQVTPENAKVKVSEHFALGQFLTKNQADVWPKYLVLQPRLLDKLELTIAKLRETGHPVRNFFVMSGFRTPDYNALDLGPKARSKVSRHMYGDAADVYPDDDGNGMLDDLNGDGRVDLADARVLVDAAEAVEREHPSLVGGIGIYPGNGAHGPFVHIDVRGKRARWNG
jgi:uncharacterized protein YcbK (DUF882 family)